MILNGIGHSQFRCLWVNNVITINVITIDEKYYCCTNEVIKFSRVAQFKTTFY